MQLTLLDWILIPLGLLIIGFYTYLQIKKTKQFNKKYKEYIQKGYNSKKAKELANKELKKKKTKESEDKEEIFEE